MSAPTSARGDSPHGARAPDPRRGFCASPKRLVSRPDVVDAVKVLLAALAGLCRTEEWSTTASIARIAEACGWADKTWKAKRAMAGAVAAGLVERGPTPGAPGHVWTTRLLYNPRGFDDPPAEASEEAGIRLFDPDAPRGAGAPTPGRRRSDPGAQALRPRGAGAPPSSRRIQTELDFDDVDAGSSSSIDLPLEEQAPEVDARGFDPAAESPLSLDALTARARMNWPEFTLRQMRDKILELAADWRVRYDPKDEFERARMIGLAIEYAEAATQAGAAKGEEPKGWPWVRSRFTGWETRGYGPPEARGDIAAERPKPKRQAVAPAGDPKPDLTEKPPTAEEVVSMADLVRAGVMKGDARAVFLARVHRAVADGVVGPDVLEGLDDGLAAQDKPAAGSVAKLPPRPAQKTMTTPRHPTLNRSPGQELRRDPPRRTAQEGRDSVTPSTGEPTATSHVQSSEGIRAPTW